MPIRLSIPKFIEEPCESCLRSTRTVINPEWLKHQRIAAGISLGQMALRLGYSKQYIADLEDGSKRVRPDALTAYEALVEVAR